MKRTLIAIAAVAAVLGAVALTAVAVDAHGPRWGMGYGGANYGGGPCWMNPGAGYGPGMKYGPGRGYGRGMMGFGPGRGGYGPMWGGQVLAKELTVDDVKAFFEQRMAWRGNPNVKLGEVTEKDDTTIVAEILTKDDSLARRIEIDRKTGRHTPVN
jgi:hypothetical protein